MKKSVLLNAALSQVIASMGHGDLLLIGDAGLPAPAGVPVIDLALTRGIPDFMSVLNVVLSELQVESHVVAQEMSTHSPDLAAAIQALGLPGQQILPHETFKQRGVKAKVFVRTGECTPYANIILASGVVF